MAKISKAKRARRAKAEREWGEVRALGLSVYRNKRGAFSSDEALALAVAEARAAFPGSKIKYGKATRGKRWRAEVVFPFPISREVMAKKIGRVAKTKGQNSRLHMIAIMRNRSVEPLSNAHANAREAVSEAQDQLLTNYFQYPRDDDSEDMDEQQIKHAVARIDRRRAPKQARDARGRFK